MLQPVGRCLLWRQTSWLVCFVSQVELNEIESSCEEYPLTRSFCHLISTLVENSLPINLGAGLRVPGFQPYLDFLRDSVFLPFPTRAYRRPAEKVNCCIVLLPCLCKEKTCSCMHVCIHGLWTTTHTPVWFVFPVVFPLPSQWEVADAVLEVFHKLLRDYEPQPSDFVQEMVELQGEQVSAHKPPGHSIMFHLLNDSPMLVLCLSLLEEGVRQLDTYALFPGERTYAVLHSKNERLLVCMCVFWRRAVLLLPYR